MVTDPLLCSNDFKSYILILFNDLNDVRFDSIVHYLQLILMAQYK